MSTRSQKRKAVEELVSGEFDTNIVNSNNLEIEQAPGPSRQKSPKIRPENIDEVKTSLKSEIGLSKNSCGKSTRNVENDSSHRQEKTLKGTRIGLRI